LTDIAFLLFTYRVFHTFRLQFYTWFIAYMPLKSKTPWALLKSVPRLKWSVG